MTSATYHILVTDDNEDIREVIVEMLDVWVEEKAFTLEIHEASNGVQALDWVNKHGAPDLLLLDVRMPEMNGAEFIRQVAAQGLDLREKTLLLTGYADDMEEHLGSDALLMKHLRKPFMAEDLFAKLDAIAL
ncbi:MAG: response regulator [Mariprofundus sp.]|nr:response regulator [Mariprofundus sp.]